MQGRWLTEKQAAQLLGLAPSTLRAWRVREARGEQQPVLPWRRFGRAVRYWIGPELLGQVGQTAGPDEEKV